MQVIRIMALIKCSLNSNRLISADNIPIQYGGLSRLNDTEFSAGSAPVHELFLKGGKSTSIDIEVTEVMHLSLILSCHR